MNNSESNGIIFLTPRQADNLKNLQVKSREDLDWKIVDGLISIFTNERSGLSLS